MKDKLSVVVTKSQTQSRRLSQSQMHHACFVKAAEVEEVSKQQPKSLKLETPPPATNWASYKPLPGALSYVGHVFACVWVCVCVCAIPLLGWSCIDPSQNMLKIPFNCYNFFFRLIKLFWAQQTNNNDDNDDNNNN